MRIATIILIALLTLANAQSVWNGSVNTAWYTNNSSATEFTITTAEQLAGLAELVYYGNSFSDKVIKLGANIMLNDTTYWKNWENNPPTNSWKPIGTDSEFGFNGIFDGRGFVVNGVYINSINNRQGLFGYLGLYGAIKSLGVTASYIKGGSSVGGLVGDKIGQITSSYFSGIVNGTNDVGGLAGYSQSKSISGSYSSGTVTGEYNIGGLVGMNNTYSNINNSYSSCMVIGGAGDINSSNRITVGGLVGHNGTKISNSYFTGTVTGAKVTTNSSNNTSVYVGGLAGYNYGGTINNSYSTGTVTGTRTTGGNASVYVGGLVGENVSTGTISNSYSTSPVIGSVANNSGSAGGYSISAYIGGLVAYNNGTINNSYSIGTIKGTGTNNNSNNNSGGNVYIGGLVGYSYSGMINNNYSVSTMTGTKAGTNSSGVNIYFGGLVGYKYNESSTTIRGSYYNNQISGQNDIGKGDGKTTVEMKQKATFIGWDFDEIWGINSAANDGYPYLQWSVFSVLFDVSKKEFIINTAEEFTEFARLVNDGYDFEGKIIKLGRNIALNDTANWRNWANNPPASKWIPIGTNNNTFNGTFNGNGYVISGVYINSTSIYQGLFGYLNSSGTVKNLGIVASYIKGESATGGLAGMNYGTIDNSYFIGTVEGTSAGGLAGMNYGTIDNSNSAGIVSGIGTSSVGGLVYLNSETISNSYSTSTISGSIIGGLVCSNSKSGTIDNSYFIGAAEGTSSAGGLVASNEGTITNSYASGTVKGIGSGGLVLSNNGTINNSYSANTVNSQFGGGLVYINGGIINNSYSTSIVNVMNSGAGSGLVYSNSGTITNSYYNKETSGQNDEGEGKTTAEMRQRATFIGWDFNEIWGIDSNVNCGYPHLLDFDYSKNTNNSYCPSAISPNSSSSGYNPSSSSNEFTPIKISKVAKANKTQIISNGVSLQVVNNASLEVFSLNGNSLRKINFANGIYSVEFSDLPKGLYIVKVKFENLSREILRIPVK
jgi:hypothetical protein